MKHYHQLIFGILLISLWSCTNEKHSYKPSDYLNYQQQQEVLSNILPHFAKLPRKYEEAELDSFYNEEIKKYRIQHYYISEEDSFHYFMVNRPAPSLYEKRLAIAGKFQKDKNGNITSYEESFWTFKMKIPDLEKKGLVLFADYVNGKDMSVYMPRKKGEEEWIEFPDARCYYDKKELKWKFYEQNSQLSGDAKP